MQTIVCLALMWSAAEAAPVPDTEAIRKLVKQLGDDDFVTREKAQDELLRIGPAALPLLREAAAGNDIEASVRARALIRKIGFGKSWELLKERFTKLSQQPDDKLDFEAAVFDLARLETPEFDDAPHRAKLDALAAKVKADLGGKTDPASVAASLVRVIGEDEGISGSKVKGDEAYYSVGANFVHVALDKKRGLPLTLSLVHMFVAKRLNLPVAGVSAPGHFICKVVDKDPKREVFIDAFEVRTFTRADLGASADETDLTATTAKPILRRMLANLTNSYTRVDDQDRVRQIEELTRMLAEK